MLAAARPRVLTGFVDVVETDPGRCCQVIVGNGSSSGLGGSIPASFNPETRRGGPHGYCLSLRLRRL